MKKIVVTLLLFIGLIGYSQTNGITYQAVILNPSGEQLPGVNNTNAPLANKYICLKFSIIDNNSQSEYIETVQTTTDEFGMVNLVIGTGVQIGGYASSFSNILWNANPKSLKVDLSTTGICSYYTEISNQPFTAVPFALYAVNSESTAALAALQATVAANATATTNALALKEDAINKSTTTTLGTSNVLFPTQNAVKTYVDTNISTVNASNAALQATVTANATAASNAIAAVQSDVNQNELDSNAADVILQNNITTLQNTITSNATATTTALGLKEDAANKSTTTTLGTSNVLFPTQNAVKTYVDTNISTVNASNAALQATVTANATAASNAIAAVQSDVNQNELDSNAADVILQNNITTLQNTVTSNATATTTALGLKEDAANKSTTTTLGTSNVLFPTQNAVKTYVDTNISTVNASNAALQATVTANATAASNAIAAVQSDVNQNEVDSDAADVLLQNNITTLQNTVTSNATATITALGLKEDAANKSTDVTLSDTTNTKFPTELAVKTYVANQVSNGTATNVSGIVGIANGGTGSATQNFVDLTTTQNIAGNKSFGSDIIVNGLKVGNGGGSQSTVLGDSANATQSNNTALGFMVLDGNSGTDNTAVGTNSMRNSGATSMNTSIGENSGTGVNTGNGNTYLGYNANVTDNSTISNATAIGANALVSSSNTIQLGNTSTTDIKTSGKLTTGSIILPNTDGTSGQVLTTNGSGIVDWSSPSSISISSINANSDVNGATITNGVLRLSPADATNGGVVTAGTQTFSGNKTVVGNFETQNSMGSPVLDINANNPTSPVGAPDTDSRQSFNAGISGNLSMVKIKLFSSGTYTFTIYQGGNIMSQNNPGGTQIFQSTFTSINSQIVSIPITNTQITAGNLYWLQITGGSATVGLNWGQSNVGSTVSFPAYSGGLSQSWIFQTFVSQLTGGNITAAGTITAGSVTYPNTHGTANQVLTTNGSGTLSWSNPSGSASSLTGMVTSVGNVATVVTNANLTGAITSSGNATSLGSFTSSDVATALTNETGTGAVVLSDSPSLTGLPLAPTPSNTTDTNQIATTAFIQDLLLNAPATSPSLSGAIWTSATTGTLNGVGFTIGSYTMTSTAPSLLNSNYSTADYSSNPLSATQETTYFMSGSSWTVTFDSPISNFKLYVYWRSQGYGGSSFYQFNQPFTIATGSTGLTNSGNTLNVTGWGKGILEFSAPITSLTLSANGTSCCSGHTMTFGTVTGSASSAGSGQVIRVDSPNLEGIPTAPTATAGTNTTQIATTEFVNNAVTSVAQNFVDLSSNQTVAGSKTFSSDITVNGLTIGRGIGQVNEQNITMGGYTLANNTTGQLLIAIGNSSLYSNTSANYNIGIGASTLSNNQTGENNIAIGVASLNSNTGANNTAVGRSASQLGSANSNVTSVGFQAGMRNTGNSNTFLGTNTDQNSPSSSITNSTALGFGAKISAANQIQLGNTAVTNVNTSGSYTGSGFKTPTGTSSQYLMADGSVSSGSSSSGVPYTGATGLVDLGAFDLKVNGLTVGIGSGNQTSNVVLGKSAMENNSTGGYSVAVGLEALKSNTNGNSNTAVGHQALKSNTTGGANIAIGMNAMLNNINGSQNIAIGQSTLNNNTSASGNTVIGHSAGVNISTGSSNTIIGQEAAGGLTTGSWNTIIGRNAYTGNISNNIVLSNGQGSIKAQHDGTNWTLSGTTTATGFKTPTGTSSQYLMADGSVSSGSSSSGVPYTGATAAVNLGDYNLTVNGLTIGSNGTSMMGDSYSSTVIGNQATIGSGYSAASESSAFGYKASATGPQSIAIGSEASANQTQGISIGYHASVGTGYGFAIGSYSQSNGMHSAALGPFSQTSGNYSVALGYQANATAENSIAIGKDANVTTANTIQLGNTDITDVKTSGSLTAKSIISSGRMVMSTATIEYSQLNNYDVSNVSILFVRPNSTWTSIYGLTGGVLGQVIHIYSVNDQTSNCCTGLSLYNFDSSSNTGTQKFVAPGGINIDSNKNTTLVFDGTYWRVSKLGGM